MNGESATGSFGIPRVFFKSCLDRYVARTDKYAYGNHARGLTDAELDHDAFRRRLPRADMDKFTIAWCWHDDSISAIRPFVVFSMLTALEQSRIQTGTFASTPVAFSPRALASNVCS